MRIDNSQTSLVVDFSLKDYFLVHFKEKDEWTLNHRIDMSYKGKEDQVGTTRLHLEEYEVEMAKKAGFSWIEI